jgi:hypothetical protein
MTKTRKITTWALAGFLAFGFLFAGVTKLIGAEMQIKNLISWRFPLWTRFPIGLIEVVLAITILIPKYRKLTIYAVFVWTLLAVLTHVQAGQASMIGGAILFSILGGLILIFQKGKGVES